MEADRAPWSERWGPLLGLACALTAFSWAMGRHLDDIATLRMGRDFLKLYDAVAAGLLDGTSPLLLLLLKPLARLELKNALGLWLLLNQVFLALTVWGAATTWRAATTTPARELFSVSFAAFVAFTAPVMDHNWQGQTHLLALALATWSVAFHMSQRDVHSGLCLAPAMLIDPSYALFALFFVVRRRPFTVLQALGLCVAFALAFDHSAFVTEFIASVRASDVQTTTGNLSMDATARALGAPVVGALALRVAPIAAVLFLTHRETSGSPLEGALRLAQGLLLLSCVKAEWWAHDLVALVPAFYLALHASMSDRLHRTSLWLTVAAGGIVTLVHHPLVFWNLLAGPDYERIRSILWELDRAALLMLFVAIELLLRQRRRGTRS